jgi:hypothetical protein
MSARIQIDKNISEKIIALVEQARYSIAKNVSSAMLFTYYHIGKILVEEYIANTNGSLLTTTTITYTIYFPLPTLSLVI